MKAMKFVGFAGVALALTACRGGTDVRSTAIAGLPPQAVTVTGRLLMLGGPRGAPTQGVAGDIHFFDGHGFVGTVMTAADGTFSFPLAPGTYTIQGRAPAYVGTPVDGSFPCRADWSIRLPADHKLTVNVYCQRR